MNVDRGGGGNQYDVFDNILQLVGACYVSSRPNAVSKSPSSKLNESTSANRSFSKKGLQLSLSLEEIDGHFLSAELLLLLYWRLC